MFDGLKATRRRLDARHQARALRGQREAEGIRRLRQMVPTLLGSSGVLSPSDFQRFVQVVTHYEIPLRAHPDIRDPVLLGLAQGGHFLDRATSLVLRQGESAVWDERATLLREVTDREWRGRSRGVSVPLGLGMRYRVGASRGRTVEVGTHWETADEGALTVTDRRVAYHGVRKNIEFPYSKLTTVDLYGGDAIALAVSTRQTVSTFRLYDAPLLAGLIRAAMHWSGRGLTVIR
jgi:hypothetical protein